MKLLHCHIDGFGRLADYDREFDRGLNIILEDNGWGKSTFAAFLLVMLYGFGNERKKSELENERRRYAPWKSDVYGGSILMEASGRVYRIERTFGTRDGRDDTYSVTDASTNLPAEELGSVPGEALFSIDRDSFMRTIFVGQQDCSTKVTPGISAKIGGIADENGDMNEFETVRNRLKSELDSLSPVRKTGSISRLETRIAELEEEAGKKEALEQALEQVTNEKSRRRSRIDGIIRDQRALQSEMERLGKKKDRQSEQDQLALLRKAEESSLEQFREERKTFPGDVPDTAELDHWMEEAARTGTSADEEEGPYALSPQERETYEKLYAEFEEGVPSEEELDAASETLKSIRFENTEMRAKRLSEEENRRRKAYRERFGNYLPAEEEVSGLIKEWSARTRKKNSLETRKANVRTMKGMLRARKEELEIHMAEDEAQRYYDENFGDGAENGSPVRRLAVFFGTALLLLGVFLSGLVYKIVMEHKGILQAFGEVFRSAFGGSTEITLAMVAVGMMGLGLILLIAVIVNMVMSSKAEEEEDGISEEEQLFREAVEEYRAEKKSIQEDEESIAAVDKVIYEFLGRMGIESEEEDVDENLYEIRSQVREYQVLQKRYQEYRENIDAEARERQKAEVRNLLALYYPDLAADEDLSRKLQQLRYDVRQYAGLSERVRLNARSAADTRSREAEVMAYIAGLGIEPSENPARQLKELRDCRRNLVLLQKEYRARRKAREEFQEKMEETGKREPAGTVPEKEAAEGDMPFSGRTLEELSAAFNRNQEELEENQEILAGCLRQETELNDELDAIQAGETELEQSREEAVSLRHRYEVIASAKSYLERAKIQFSSRYMEPVKEAFDRWYRVLSDHDGTEFRMDANLNLTAREAGAARDLRSLSEGYQDMAGLCRRMAMADVMYRDEKPFLIMDDPFVNLDGKKLAGARRFLDEAAEAYQIIYFSCHESRI